MATERLPPIGRSCPLEFERATAVKLDGHLDLGRGRGEVEGHEPSGVLRGPRDAERRSMVLALKRCSWNQAEAARRLGMSRSTLADRCGALAIECPLARRFGSTRAPAHGRWALGENSPFAEKAPLNQPVRRARSRAPLDPWP
jgi:hypothetical protein